MKGFADVADKESFSAALLTQQTRSLDNFPESQQQSEQSQEHPEESASAAKRKRQRHGSGSIQLKSGPQDQPSPNSPLQKRQSFQSSKQATDLSTRLRLASIPLGFPYF